MARRCSLCDGKLRHNICTECGLDNSKNDSMYKDLLKRGECEDKPLTHVHNEPAEKPKPIKIEKKAAVTKPAQNKEKATSYGYEANVPKAKSTYTATSGREKKKKGILGKMIWIVFILFFVINIVGSLFSAIVDEFSYGGFEEVGVSKIFDDEIKDAGEDDMYHYVSYELEETGVSWAATLTSGDYVVGVHIPEGTYKVIAESGDCYISVNDWDNSIYLWEEMAPAEMELEDTYTEIHDLRLYEGAVVQLDGYYGLWFETENANQNDDPMANPLTEEVMMVNEQVLTAGIDFPAGTYDVVAPVGGGYLDFKVPVPEGEEYSEYYMSTIWLYDENDGDIRYRNLVIPEGVQVYLYGYDENQSVTLRPSAVIATEDYEGYYLGTY